MYGDSGLRHVNEYEPLIHKTVHFSHTYFHNVLVAWNALDNDIRESNTLGEFKGTLLAKMRPNMKSVFEVRDIRGVRCLTKLRVKFSPLTEHTFGHNVASVSPICERNSGIEDDEQFFLHCPSYDQMRNDLLDQLSRIPGLELGNLSSGALCELLLFGNPRFNDIANKVILEGWCEHIQQQRIIYV